VVLQEASFVEVARLQTRQNAFFDVLPLTICYIKTLGNG
jgi:hypothetical protein